MNQHAKEARRKIEGNKKIKHKRIADDLRAVSSIHYIVSRALRVRMPTKPKKTIIPAPPQPPLKWPLISRRHWSCRKQRL